jgi:hypothetical protein
MNNMLFSQSDRDKWIHLARMIGGRIFRKKTDTIKTSSGTEGVNEDFVVKDGTGTNKTLTIREGIIIDISS